MRIYPDPELPDVKIEWITQDCRAGDEVVALTLDSEDSTDHRELSVACTELTATFADVKRERYLVKGELRNPAGALITPAEYEVDLRNGLDESAFLYFGGFDNFRVSWTFDMGATCDSLHVAYIEVRLTDQIGLGLACDFGSGTGNAPDGDFTATLRAFQFGGDAPVAESAPKMITINSATFTDLGTFTLVPVP
jgi:hypothetical protein